MNDEVAMDSNDVIDDVAGVQELTNAPDVSDASIATNSHDAVDVEDSDDEAITQDQPDAPDAVTAQGSADALAPGAHDGPPTITNESITEAVLFATDSPVPAARIAQILGVGGAAQVKKHIESLNEKYKQQRTSFRIEEIAKGYQMLTLPEYNTWLGKLLKVRRESKLSQAALETLAVVAYRQPVMRVGIEEIRGVAVGEVLQRLREMNLVKIVGRAEEIGRPLLYGTTKQFLGVFGLASLSELPKVESLTPPEKQAKHAPRPPKESTSDPTSDHDATVDADAGAGSDAAVDRGPAAVAPTDSDSSQVSSGPPLPNDDGHVIALSGDPADDGSSDAPNDG